MHGHMNVKSVNLLMFCKQSRPNCYLLHYTNDINALCGKIQNFSVLQSGEGEGGTFIYHWALNG